MSAFENKIQSIREAYKNGLYEPALALALTLPDICGAIKYCSDEVGDRYIKWSNDHIFLEDPSNNGAIFAGAALYRLRCAFLHSGNDYIYKDTAKGKDNYKNVYIKYFELMNPKTNEEGIGELLSRAEIRKDIITNEEFYTVKVSIRKIIDDICDAAEAFYVNWNNKSDFDDHAIIFQNYNA